MKVILVFVSTLDGKVTKWGDPFVRSWSSEADQKYFTELLKSSELIIIGSNTFMADPLKPSDKHLVVVLSGHPSDYKKYEIPGRIEFSDNTPAQLADRFTKEGYSLMTLVGGPAVATSFLKDNLVDEIWLTIEPKIFGTGGSFVREIPLDIGLRLISCDRINEQGSLILKYSVNRYPGASA